MGFLRFFEAIIAVAIQFKIVPKYVEIAFLHRGFLGRYFHRTDIYGSHAMAIAAYRIMRVPIWGYIKKSCLCVRQDCFVREPVFAERIQDAIDG